MSSFSHICSQKNAIFNHYLARHSFELKELSRWLHHLSWTAVTNYFPSAGFKIKQKFQQPFTRKQF